MSIKLVVSGSSKESRIALVGLTGKELLGSATFTEPRAKGATLRALKNILGPDVIVEDSTTTIRQLAKPVAAGKVIGARTAGMAANLVSTNGGARVPPRRRATASTKKTAAVRKTTKRAAKSVRSA